MKDTVHLHKSQLFKSSTFYALLVPIAVFAIILAAYLFASQNKYGNGLSSIKTDILGTQTQLDN